MDNSNQTPPKKDTVIIYLLRKIFDSRQAKVSYADVVILMLLWANRHRLCDLIGQLLYFIE
jgi:hypothetical protein